MSTNMAEVSTKALVVPRVLVVEDEAEWREIYSKNLRDWGYEPIIALASETVPLSDRIASLLEDARKKARYHRCHVALVDMRLRENTADESGLQVVPELAPTVSIVISAHGNIHIVNKALGAGQQVPFRPYAFISKTDVEQKLKGMIDDVLRQYWPYLSSDVKLVLDESLQETLSRRFSAEEGVELDALLRQTFSASSVLRLEPIGSSRRPQGLSLRSHSLVLQATADSEVPIVVKIARSKRVAEERENYERFVPKFFTGRFYGRHVRSESMWAWGCALYEHLADLGQNMRIFTDFYIQESPKRIGTALERLGNNLNNLYLRTHQPSSVSLFAAYKDAWGDEWCRSLLSWRIEFSVPEVFHMWGLPDPIKWIRQRIDVLNPMSRDATSTLPWPDKAVIHGDLHGENMIVDGDGNIWVIDYERTCRGPILQDWAELENDILTRLIPVGAADLSTYAGFVVRLLGPDTIAIASAKGRNTDNKELQKALKVLRVLRQQVQETTGVADIRLYLWSLLFNLIYRLMYWQTHSDRSQESQVRLQRCLVLGGLICHRLEYFETKVGGWPPRDWTTRASTKQKSREDACLLPQRPVLKLQLTELTVEQRQFKVAVLDQPNQQPYATSQLPFWGDDLAAVMKLLELGGYRSDTFSPVQTTALERLGLLQNGQLVDRWCDRIGDHLFKALVPAEGGVQTAFANVFHTDRKGGELQVIFDKGATDLASQPWEMIHDGYPDDPRTPIDVVRYIASDRQAQALEVPQTPCQILYVTARPDGYAKPAFDRNAIKDSVARSASPERFRFNELPDRTHNALKQRLLDTSTPPVHILHFDGHGTFARLCPNPTCDAAHFAHESKCAKCGTPLDNAHAPARGYLLFEDDQGKVKFVDTTKFLEGVQRSEVRLVVLSSCHSARVRGADLLLAGVGPGLILAGVPAVVAMQFSISDQDAIKFNQEFYEALAQGDSLPSAVYRARTMLDEPARWSPVLYLRSKDHQIHLCPPK